MLNAWLRKHAKNSAVSALYCAGLLGFGVPSYGLAAPVLGAFYIEAMTAPLPDDCLRDPRLRCDRAIGAFTSAGIHGGMTLVSAKLDLLHGSTDVGDEARNDRKSDSDRLQLSQVELGGSTTIVLGSVDDKAVFLGRISLRGASFVTESIEISEVDEFGRLGKPVLFSISNNDRAGPASNRPPSYLVKSAAKGCLFGLRPVCYDEDPHVAKKPSTEGNLRDLLLMSIRAKLGVDIDAILVTTAFHTRPGRLTFGIGKVVRSSGDEQNVALFVDLPVSSENPVMVGRDSLAQAVVTDLSDDLRKIGGSKLSLLSAAVNMVDGRVYFVGAAECPKDSAVSCRDLTSFWSVGLSSELLFDLSSITIGRNLNNSLFRIGMNFPQIVFDRTGSGLLLDRLVDLSSQQSGAISSRKLLSPVTIRLAAYKHVKL